MKLKTVYSCQSCGYNSPKWLGQCPDCQGWNTMAEEAVAAGLNPKAARRTLTEFSSEVVNLSDTAALDETRIPSGIAELDNLLGGGLVKGQVVLLAGPPGIGKSTLMLEVAEQIAKAGKVLYVTGEESAGQVGARARRLKIKNGGISLLSENNLQKIEEVFNDIKPQTLVIDSIQTVFHPEMASSPGTVGQVRECAAELLRLCKQNGAILFLLGHVTKEGELAGPKVLEHIVDTVLYFDAERHGILRLLRAYKNRFGPTSELGIFQMTERGLVAVDDANAFFTDSARSRPLTGRAFSVAMEGSRPILAELQALVAPTHYPFPRRMATGMDLNRCQILFAALEKHLGLRLENKDIFVTVAGGIKLSDPALDLAVCAAVISSMRDFAVPNDWVFIGEAGILGQTAKVSWISRRLTEAQRLGFKRAFAPGIPRGESFSSGLLEVCKIDEVKDLLEYLSSPVKQRA